MQTSTTSPAPGRLPPTGGTTPSTAKRELILNAAQHVFAEEGFHAARIDAIARLAGIAKGTVYLYFRSKEEILVALIEDRFARLRTLIRKQLLLTSDPREPLHPSTSDQVSTFDPDKKVGVRESIRRIIDAHFTFYREHQEFIAILYGQLGKIARNMEGPAKCSAEEITQLITGVLTKGVACGVLRPADPRTLTLALQGMIHAVAFDWAVGQNNMPPDEAAETVFQLFWAGAVRVPQV